MNMTDVSNVFAEVLNFYIEEAAKIRTQSDVNVFLFQYIVELNSFNVKLLASLREKENQINDITYRLNILERYVQEREMKL